MLRRIPRGNVLLLEEKSGERLAPALLTVATSVFLLCGMVFLDVREAGADPYLNSSELQCNGSDPTVLMCDDFEDGDWAVSNCERPTESPGPSNPSNDGWCM